MGSEALAYHEPDLRSKSELYGRYTREALQVGMLYSGADYVQAQRVRSLIKAGCLALFRSALGADGEGVDVLITPSRPTVAPVLAGYDTDVLFLGTNFSGIWNVTPSSAAMKLTPSATISVDATEPNPIPRMLSRPSA